MGVDVAELRRKQPVEVREIAPRERVGPLVGQLYQLLLQRLGRWRNLAVRRCRILHHGLKPERHRLTRVGRPEHDIIGVARQEAIDKLYPLDDGVRG